MKTMNGDGNFHAQAPISKQLMYVLLGTAAILSVPLVAMQFTSEVDWNLFDFLVMGALIGTIGSIYVFAARLVRTSQNRIILGIAMAFLLFICWAELAVGIFGSPFAGS